MSRDRLQFLFLNVGHFLDHLFMLIFATVAAVRLADEWGMSYAALIPYATPGFADTPPEIALGLLAIGVFAAIYHPVGVAMVVEGRRRTGVPLAINGVSGNLGVAAAALLTGYLIDTAGWRSAFVLPGAVAIGLGLAYAVFLRAGRRAPAAHRPGGAAAGQARAGAASIDRATFVRVLAIILFTTAIGGLQAVFFALMYRLTGAAALAVAVAFMLVVFGQIPINDVLVGRITTSAWRSRVYSLRYIVTFSVMASTVPLIAGIHAGWGFGALFVVMAISASAIFVAVLMLPRTATSV